MRDRVKWKLKKKPRIMMSIWLVLACMMLIWPYYAKRIHIHAANDLSDQVIQQIQNDDSLINDNSKIEGFVAFEESNE